MSTPTTFPANVTLADGRAAVVMDRNGYNAAVAAGAVHSTATPITARATSGSRTQSVQEIALANDETDARPGTGSGRNR
jgi:hypothetical protein